MSGNEDDAPPEKPFYVDRAKTGRAGCKKCKQKIASGELRMAKLGYNPFGSGTMKMWHHVPCIFEVFKRQRATTKKIETRDDIGGWDDISKEDQDEIKGYFSEEVLKNFGATPSVLKDKDSGVKPSTSKDADSGQSNSTKNDHKDSSFREFRRLCVDVANESSYTGKTSIVRQLFEKGSDGRGFKGSIELWCRLLLPGAEKKVYNLQSKQLVKVFSRILRTDHNKMLEDLEKGDVAETIGNFFENNHKIKPCTKATLTLQDIDDFLSHLSKLTKEDEQAEHFTEMTKKCTVNDLKMIIRLIKHDLRINAGPKHILEAVHADAYEAFQKTRDLKSVIKEALATKNHDSSKTVSKGMSKGIRIMTPVLPMLAQACKSIEMAMKKCPNGMFSEIKYDGERVQLHKQGNTFKYFSRSLKPVLPHKISPFKDYIPKAFPHGQDLIIDSEILMVDTKTGQPLPFGTLGKHKKNEFKDACVCLFIFDCIYYNGESLVDKPIKERKEILHKNMVEVKNHVMFSEQEEIHDPSELQDMMNNVFKLGLEGLVLKDIMSSYEPGKRHWLKVKKDYLFGGAMADTADLVVLGAWFGTGAKGGIMSSFLMGCLDTNREKWVTVTKVSGGHDDKTLNKIQKELDVVKISKDFSKVPSWLKCTKTMVPDFVAKDPKKMPVWEITGAEFTRNQVHTADGISVRFPRVTKIREDKNWETATNLKELKDLYEKSKDTSDFSLDKASPKKNEPDKKEATQVKRKQTSPNNTKKKFKPAENDSDNDTKSKTSSETDDYGSDTETEPEIEQQTPKQSDITLTNPLPEVFKDTVIELPTDLKDYALLRRYIIAYGGCMYDPNKNLKVENAISKVTHVVHKKDSFKHSGMNNRWTKGVKHVVVNWVWDSIKLLEKQRESKYMVSSS